MHSSYFVYGDHADDIRSFKRRGAVHLVVPRYQFKSDLGSIKALDFHGRASERLEDDHLVAKPTEHRIFSKFIARLVFPFVPKSL